MIGKEKLDKIIEKIAYISDEDKDQLAVDFDRHLSDQKDVDALDFGIERLTVLDRDGNHFLIVKPSDIMPMLQVNIHSGGVITIDRETKIDVSLTDICDEFFRLSISGDGLTYWVDLYDLDELKRVSKFFDVEIQDPTSQK